MTDPLEELARLAERARQEHLPAGDVSGRVLARIREEERSTTLPLAVFATGSVVTAAAVTVYSAVLVSALTDPLSSLFQTASAIVP